MTLQDRFCQALRMLKCLEVTSRSNHYRTFLWPLFQDGHESATQNLFVRADGEIKVGRTIGESELASPEWKFKLLNMTHHPDTFVALKRNKHSLPKDKEVTSGQRRMEVEQIEKWVREHGGVR